jgi:hypothetical protein
LPSAAGDKYTPQTIIKKTLMLFYPAPLFFGEQYICQPVDRVKQLTLMAIYGAKYPSNYNTWHKVPKFIS